MRQGWTLAALWNLSGLGAVDGAFAPDVRITSLADDSRRVKPGGCFVAVRGGGVDGHDFVGQACAAGASVIVAEREVSVPGGVARVLVRDSRGALARLAPVWFGVSGCEVGSFPLIGITGTNGKTTVAWQLRSVLREAGHRAAVIGTIEYDLVGRQMSAALTTPGALELCRHLAEARDAGATHGVLEVSSHALDQRRCDGLLFRSALFTNLSGDHLDYHGNMEAYADAKRRLFALLEQGGTAVINVDDETGRRWAEALDGPVITYGVRSNDADVTAGVLSMDGEGATFLVRGLQAEITVRSSLVGEHNVSNAVAAAAVAGSLGVCVETIRVGLEALPCVPGRLERVDSRGCPFSVVVDYAHTDAALANSLGSLRPVTEGRLICVFGCGGDRDRSKRPRMAAAVSGVADVAYLTSDNPRTEDPQRIVEDARVGFGSGGACQVRVEVDRRAAIARAIGEALPGDTVLIAGKGHETFQLVGDEVRPFDDAAVARGFLAQRSVMEGAL